MPAVDEVWADGPSLLASIARHWLAIIGAIAVIGGTAYVAEAGKSAEFEAAAVLEFAGVQQRVLDPAETAPGDPVRRLHNRTEHMRSRAVLERASNRLDGASVESLREAIEIVADPDRADTVTIIARAGDPDDVAAIANAVAEAYQEVSSERERSRQEAAISELDQTIGRLQARLADLDAQSAEAQTASAVLLQRSSIVGQFIELTTRRERLATAAALAHSGVTSFDRAPPGRQAGPSPKMVGALGAFVGLAFASAYAYWREGHAGAARSAEDVRAALGVPLLAQLPLPSGRRRWRWPRMWRRLIAARSEPYQFLGVAVDRTLSWLPAANILIADVRPSRSGAVAALNIAIALCQEHRQVLLIDADLRNRRLTLAWQLDGKLGLADLNERAVSVGQTTVVAGTGKDSTWSFMPAGRRHRDPFSSIRGPALRRALDEVEGARPGDRSSRIVVHAPAVLEAADGGAIAPLVDGVVLIVDKGTRIDDVVGAGELIDAAGGRLLGFAFVGGWRAARRQVSPHGPRRPVTRSPVPVR